jgi:integrase/transposase
MKKAKELEAEFRLALRAKAAKQAGENAAPATLNTLCDFYLQDLETRKVSEDTINSMRSFKRRLTEFFETRMQDPLETIKEEDLRAYHNHRKSQKLKPSSLDHELGYFRTMIHKVRPEFRFPEDLFAKEYKKRVRWLTPQQREDVLGRLRSPYREIVLLAMLTLLRLSNILRLRKSEVHFIGIHGWMEVDTKTGPKSLVLSSVAAHLLRKQIESHDNELVFPNRKGRPFHKTSISKKWRTAARDAGIVDFHFHDLRHHGTMEGLNNGAQRESMQAFGGWDDPKSMDRYACLVSKPMLLAAELVAGRSMAEAIRIVESSVLPIIRNNAAMPEDHIASIIADVVDTLDRVGSLVPIGSEGEPPQVAPILIKLLSYAYCTGRFSSRAIALAIREEQPYQFLAADQHPDYRTLAAFRDKYMAQALEKTLALCRQAGVPSFGQVALTEGTELTRAVEMLLGRAAQIDGIEDAEYTSQKVFALPAELARRETRLERFRAAQATLSNGSNVSHLPEHTSVVLPISSVENVPAEKESTLMPDSSSTSLPTQPMSHHGSARELAIQPDIKQAPPIVPAA